MKKRQTTAKYLRTVAQLADELPAFDEPAIRRLIFHAEDNGLAPAIFRIGRRVLIHEKLFNEWIEEGRMRSLEQPRIGRRSARIPPRSRTI